MKKYITTVLIILCISVNNIVAQTAVEKKPSPQWWLSSSFADSIDYYLFHVEGQYSYIRMTGSSEGETQSGYMKAAIRKSIFTNHTEYMIDKMHMNYKSLGVSYSTESQAFTDYLQIDLTRLLYGEAGFIWERDNTLYIKNRYTLYAGVGINGMIYEKHYLKLLFAMGRINQEYTIPVDNFDVVKGKYSAFYIRQNYKYLMDQRFSFMEQAYYLTNMSYSGRYRMSVSLNFMIGIIQPVSLVLGYTYKYDSEAKLLGMPAENTTQSIGVNISL